MKDESVSGRYFNESLEEVVLEHPLEYLLEIFHSILKYNIRHILIRVVRIASLIWYL